VKFVFDVERRRLDPRVECNDIVLDGLSHAAGVVQSLLSGSFENHSNSVN
jgi:hypothetical protein